VTGSIDTREYAGFLGKFCFGSSGVARVKITPRGIYVYVCVCMCVYIYM